MTARDWLLTVTLSVAWGISFFFIKLALHDLHPLTIVFGRVAVAALALNIILRLRGEHLPASRADWKHLLVISLLNNVIPFTLIAWAQTQIASSLTSILNASAPLWGVLLAYTVNRERLSGGRVLGMLLGFGGVIVTIGVDSLGGLGMNILAQLGMLAATFSYALSGAYTQRVRHLSPPVIAAGQVTVSTVLMLPLTLLIANPLQGPMPGLLSWAAVLELGLIGTTVAYLLYFRLLASAGASNALLTTFLIPITALLMGILLLGETLAPYHIAGMALILGGLLVIDGRIFRLVRRKQVPVSAE